MENLCCCPFTTNCSSNTTLSITLESNILSHFDYHKRLLSKCVSKFQDQQGNGGLLHMSYYLVRIPQTLGPYAVGFFTVDSKPSSVVAEVNH